MSINLIERINYGYADIEPIIIGLMAMNKSFLLIGKHGTGKTRLARVLSSGYGKGGFVFYDAPKDDQLSMVLSVFIIALLVTGVCWWLLAKYVTPIALHSYHAVSYRHCFSAGGYACCNK
jgi:hypothetical protein